jgi:glucuronate isomerase
MRRYFDQVMETAGLYNAAGFNDDARAFPSISARYRVWRCASAAWLSGLAEARLIDMNEARSMAHDLAYGLAKRAYRTAQIMENSGYEM